MYGKHFKELNTKYKPNLQKNFTKIFYEKNYSLYKLNLKKNLFYKVSNSNFFIYNCKNIIFSNKFQIHKSILVKSLKPLTFKAIDNSFCYIMFQNKSKLKISNTNKFNQKNYISYKKVYRLKKYWGEILTLFSNSKGAAKIINMNKGSQSSMEFHIKKIESYYISKGHIKLGIRFGRAKQKIINLKKNDCFLMKPGTMHMRMANKESQIIELSNKDRDNDSIIVHDGLNFKFKEIN